MRILLTLSVMLLAALGSMAQMSVIDKSFRSLASINTDASGTDMGNANMTAESLEWPTDADGNDAVSLLVVNFENMSLDDISQVNATLSGGKIIVKAENHNQEGKPTRWFFLPAAKNMDVTFSHPRFGQTRLIDVSFEPKTIYTCTLNNDATTSVGVTSDPAGATVLFDGKNYGTTPVTIPEVTMGSHTISLSSPNPDIASPLEQTVIEVSPSKSTFHYPLRKKRTIQFVPNPSNAYLTIERDGTVYDEGKGTRTIKDMEYGTYRITGSHYGEIIQDEITIDSKSPSIIDVRVVGSRSINFTASQNNYKVNGANVNINKEYIGQTPISKTLTFGIYDVEMNYQGFSKQGKLKVDKNSRGDYELVLPARRSRRYNPFDIDYQRKEWGFAVNYINKVYHYKEGRQSINVSMWGEEEAMHGVQAGIVYQPYFGYGQGLSTGVYWQAFFGSETDVEGYDYDWEEHSLYIPLQYQFRLPLHSNFSIFLNGGIGFTCGISNTAKYDDYEDSIDVGYGEEYGMPSRTSWSLLYGGGIQYKMLQVECKISRGLTDNKDMYYGLEDQAQSCKANSWSVGISLMF